MCFTFLLNALNMQYIISLKENTISLFVILISAISFESSSHNIDYNCKIANSFFFNIGFHGNTF